jgi:AraC family transcriptional regulator of adaptative response / DNA-3-methyladenine glycosylase II
VTATRFANGGLLLRLPFCGPLDWPATLAYLAARAIPGVEHVRDGTYRRTVTVGGDPGVVELSRGGEEHLLLRAHLPHWEELTHLVASARRVANLDLDVEEPARRLAADPILGPLLRGRPGVRPTGTLDPFETGVRAIVGQQVSIAAANTISGRLVERLGRRVPGLAAMGLSHTFPAPETLAVAGLDDLGLTRARAGAIRAFARAVAADTVRLDGSVGLDRLVADLGELDGLGPWTAHYLALRLGEPDAWPVGDAGLRRALQGNAGGGDAALAERWRPWRALAAAHLWTAGAARRVASRTARPDPP